MNKIQTFYNLQVLEKESNEQSYPLTDFSIPENLKEEIESSSPEMGPNEVAVVDVDSET